MSDLPEKIWALADRRKHWQAEEQQDGQHEGHWTKYRRADLPLTTAQLMADERVRALVEALEGCEAAITRGWAFYPDKVKGYTLDALENARAALAQLKEPKP